jgi:tetratricopeptide (TPR) repeat protein
MTKIPDSDALSAEGKRLFEAGQHLQAIRVFKEAAAAYGLRGDVVNKAEMQNNLSVVLLKAGQAQEALEAVEGTEDIFAQVGDSHRQAMAVGNQAAALEALQHLDEALAAYQRSAELFAQAGEGDMQSMVLKSAASLKIRRGKLSDSAISMLASLEVVERPSLLDRFLKFLLRLKP